jgi:hypothetical protein
MIKDALDAYAATLDKVWAHDRSKTIGASEIGQCARRVWWEKRKLPVGTIVEAKGKPLMVVVPPRENYGAALRGTMIENYFWYPAMKKKFGADLKFAGPRGQKTLSDGRLSSTSDGLVVNQPPGALRHLGVKDIESDCFAVECKTIDPRVNLTKEKDEHHFQAQVQMGMYRAKTKWKPVYNVVSYVDASFWSEVGEYVVKFDPAVLGVAQKRSEFIYAAERPEDLPPEGWIAGGKECEYCPFAARCDARRQDVPDGEGPLKDKQLEEQLVQACRIVQRHQKSEKAAEVEKRAAQEAVKQILRGRGIRNWPKIVSWSVIAGRESYDMKALKEAAVKKGLDLEKFCKVGEPSDRFEVKLRE